jgi:hypothetical protein
LKKESPRPVFRHRQEVIEWIASAEEDSITIQMQIVWYVKSVDATDQERWFDGYM